MSRSPLAMNTAQPFSSDVAFTSTVKALQTRKGSRTAYERMEEKGGWRTQITPDLKTFIEEQVSVFLATVNAEGQPYIQHRGGPAGFLRVLDDCTIAFVDFAVTRQYITQGNLSDNAKAHLFLIDYAHRKRVKIWGGSPSRRRRRQARRSVDDRGLPGAARASDPVQG